ncbi:DUF885 domain-containing protein [Pedomonas sp. V897]|uniref:DUF885 domain-containing protein n=1 Tax=Pedomonas sp. V897 TaxID=3446482 RepID=UPI003EE29357
MNRWRISLLALSLSLATAGLPASAFAADPADQQLRTLYETDWAWRLKETARIEKEDGSLDGADHLPRVDAASQERRAAHAREMLAKLDQVPLDQLSDEEQINAAVFRTNLEHALIDAKFRAWEMPFNSDSSFWTSLEARRPFRTAEDYRRYLGRMRDVPRYFDEQITNMRAGLKRGFTVPRATLNGREQSIAIYANNDVEANPFYAAFKEMPSTIPADEQAQLREEAKAVIRDAVVPSYTRLRAFFRDEYLPKARTTLAASALPDGKAFYAAQIRKYTTLDLMPEQIHEIGLKEVARIKAQMLQVMRDSGFNGSFEDFVQFLRTDPRFYAKTPEELLGFSAWIAKQVDGKLPDIIGTLPRRPFTIIPVPEALAPFYTAGRGGLGACMMNTYNLPSRPLYNIPALTVHECAPGHSFQAALAREQPTRPAFRRNSSFSGYGEGWGLYTEWLGIEMGIYRTPYEHFGRLSYEMWRAARLVIDTGVHHYGWSREKAIEFLASNTALSAHEVETEVDRYISWPGQALAYKLGELTIHRLRAEAEQQLGRNFDQRRFHDTILALGSVPLSVLEERIHRFIADEQKRIATAQGGQTGGATTTR